MSKRFDLHKIVAGENPQLLEATSADSKAVIALDIETKFSFQNQDGSVFHEYALPSDRDIQNCGGYIDKIIKYRSPEVKAAVSNVFAEAGKYTAREIAVLNGRSFLVDILLTKMIKKLLSEPNSSRKAHLLDHGCTVAEHFDMLDQMLSAHAGLTAANSICYYGLDISPLALSGAKMLHQHAPSENFRLILSEGSIINLAPDSVDFSMSIGVINHVHQPLRALERLIDVTKHAVVLVIWVTGEDQGFWAINHSGVANYFFSVRDLAALASQHDKGAFYYADFTPEKNSTQPSSYIGISDERLEKIGSYTLIFAEKNFVTDDLNPIDFSGIAS